MLKANNPAIPPADRSREEKRARLAALLRAQADPPAPPPRCLHRVFEEQAARAPDAIALTCEDERLTYRDLNARANRVAYRLRALGVGPESLVGLCAERSVGMVVGLLAILKAGGAYLPLDPVYPPDRLGFQFADSRARVLLVQRAGIDRFPAGDAHVIDLDEADDPTVLGDAENLDAGAVPQNLAYVIYTSGSTGTPKGVPVTHANVARLCTATQHWFHFDATDVWTLFHSFAFDFSVWEIWGALLYGGRLVVVPYWVSRAPEAFHELLRAERVTVLNQTPSAFRQLVRADEAVSRGQTFSGSRASGAGDSAAQTQHTTPPPNPPFVRGGEIITPPLTKEGPGGVEPPRALDKLPLRWVIFGGEALELQALRPWFERHGDESPRLVNMYGITETTVHVTYRPIVQGDLETFAGSSPIGRAIPDLRLHVLDPHMQPVPPGVVGEMYVGGEGVARGYLGRPALTAERFVPDPFSGQPGGRLYRSGDLARYRRDGELEYLGRADRQVKVRGFRIELGEIEAALARQPELREAVVVARPDPRGDTQLTAYIVPRVAPVPNAAELRQRLKAVLPDYMVPAAFVALDVLPLTANGKLDLAALPAPQAGQGAESAAEYVAPRTATERAIAAAWSELLGVARVGAFDDFFVLGGHSLLAAQAVYRLRDALGAEFPLRALFEASTVAALAERIDAGGPDERTTEAPIVPAPRDGDLPLSFSQQALWFLDRLTPGQPTFNVPAAVRIQGPLDAPALERSFHEIVHRHEALRTTFPAVDGRPLQAIAPELAPRLTPLDLSALPLDEREAETRRLAAEEARTPFDLAHGPLVRARLLRLGEGEHVLLLTLHHIVTDGWSMGVAARELAALYESDTNGTPSPLTDPPIQFADYAAWQRQWLDGKVLEDRLAYWSRQLDGLTPLDLPTDRPRPAVRSARGDIRFFTLPAELAADLRTLGRREGATLFMTLLAAFQTLLHRYTGQDGIAVGVPVANRNRPEVEGLIGYFVNMLVLRSDLAGDPTFQELLARVREVSLGGFEHQDLPFDKLVEALRPARDPSRTPLFDVMFVLQNNRMPDVARQELTLDAFETGEGTGTAKFDLTLAVEEVGDALIGSLEYNTDLFDGPTIERMLGHFRALLEDVTAHPDHRLSAIPLLDETDRLRIVDVWNRTVADVPAVCLHHLIEARVRNAPENTALVHADGTLSYRVLNARANRLARFLRERGIRPEMRVGLCIDRSPEMAVGLLGILKAGGAYVPLDPGEPKARLAELVNDARIGVLLTRASLRAHCDGLPAEIVALDADWSAIEGQSDQNLEGSAAPDNAAYVIYTSGSTGRPKGVVVPHRAVVNHNLAAARLFDLRADDRVLQFAPLSFDISVEEIFPAWILGAAVVLRPGDEVLDPDAFTDWVESARITVLDLPTAYWHAWVDRLARRGRAPAGALRLVVVGGEKAQPSLFAQWRNLVGGRVRWINTYGPTETTVIATAYEPPDDTDPELPIGAPITNARVYVLDCNLAPVPVGLPGELYVGGEGVSRGYLDRPSATAERFVPDPFGSKAGGRLFRTGDRVHWRADGQLVFLGRVDLQVKVRGFRIEPGEIEVALLEHPHVRAAAVIARRGGEARLDAYVAAALDEAIAPGDLRDFLRERLPGHMIPATFTVLEALPLTSSGKVDRRALPPPERGESGHDLAVEPRDEVEARLVAIWEQVLGVQPVGVNESFFDLGGHSLLAIRLLSRVEEAFGRALPLSSLFLGATVADLASHLRHPAEAAPWSPLVPLQPAGAGPGFYCVHPAGGIAYCFLELARRLPTDRPFYAFQAYGLEGESTPLGSVEEIATHYVEALRQSQPEGPYHLGGWSLGGLVAFEMARQLVAQDQEVATLALIDAHAPIPLADSARPFRALARDAAALALFREPDSAGDDDIAAEDAAVLLALLSQSAPGVTRHPRRLLAHLKELSPDAQREHALQLFDLDAVYHQERGPDRRRRLWTVLRTHLLAAARYVPQYYPGRIAVLRASANHISDPAMGWSAFANEVTSRKVPGDHTSILRPPGVDLLAEALRAELAGENARA
ncbi:MAG: amino acid adenylation domain-containing protein [Isosphaeraceae bacterium]|nr:amino acid adenylation domain-containing protein [Isosphaeraceae bacterium]